MIPSPGPSCILSGTQTQLPCLSLGTVSNYMAAILLPPVLSCALPFWQRYGAFTAGEQSALNYSPTPQSAPISPGWRARRDLARPADGAIAS